MRLRRPRGRALRAAVVLLASATAAAATAQLGLWQLDRAAYKAALQRDHAARADLPVLPATALARTPQDAEAQLHRATRLRGRWLAEATVFLDNRQMDGRFGFYVVTPLVLAPGDAVLVQRGFAPRDLRDRSALPALTTPAGEVEVRGRIAPPPARLYEFEADAAGPIRQNLDLEHHAREVGVALRPLSVLQDDDAAPADGLRRHWPAPGFDVAKHRGYALQWFALSALITGLYVWFQLLRPRLRRPR